MKKFLTLFTALLGLAIGISYVSVSCAAVSHKRELHHRQEVDVATVNINKADAKTIQTLKGIGPKKAEAIVDYREKNGKFESLSDLTKVKGISTKFLEKLEAKNRGKITLK